MKTKFIIAVTRRLAAAPDTNAKAELIEELSENLYSRYEDLTAAGVPEDEAYQRALDGLGDVNELLDYLNGLGPEGEVPPRDREAKAFVDRFLTDPDGFVRTAMGQARDAVDDAAAMLRDAAEKLRGRAGSFSFYTDEERFCAQADADGFSFSVGAEVSDIPSEQLRAVDIGLMDGDVTVRFDGDPAAPVRLAGDGGALQVLTGADGVLSVRQGRTASDSFFFGRLLRSADIEVILPRRRWEELRLSTVRGDVELGPGGECGLLSVNTANGDVEIPAGLQADRLDIRTSAGDVELREVRSVRTVLQSAAGDCSADGLTGSLQAKTLSGDVEVSGCLREVCCSTASGDVTVYASVLPESLEVSSKSGDCTVSVPDGAGFTVRFRTVSGDLHSDFPLTGPVGRSGEATYLDGGEPVFRISSVSGDVTLRRQP